MLFNDDVAEESGTDAQDEGKDDVAESRDRMTWLEEDEAFVGEGRECGQSTADTDSEESFHLRGDGEDVMIDAGINEADDETTNDIHQKSMPREEREERSSLSRRGERRERGSRSE